MDSYWIFPHISNSTRVNLALVDLLEFNWSTITWEGGDSSTFEFSYCDFWLRNTTVIHPELVNMWYLISDNQREWMLWKLYLVDQF